MTGKSVIPAKAHNQIQAIIETADKYPGVVIIHHIPELRVVYMSDRGLQELSITLEEVQNLTLEEYYTRYFNVDDTADYTPRIAELIATNTDDYITFFQQVKVAPGQDWVWHLSSMRILTRDDDGQPLHSLMVSIRVDPMHHITHKVSRLLDENTFLRKHYHTYATLGNREIEVLKLLSLGKNAGEAAKVLGISVTTVETHRRNIKRKLGAENIYDLIQFAKAFDLI